MWRVSALNITHTLLVHNHTGLLIFIQGRGVFKFLLQIQESETVCTISVFGYPGFIVNSKVCFRDIFSSDVYSNIYVWLLLYYSFEKLSEGQFFSVRSPSTSSFHETYVERPDSSLWVLGCVAVCIQPSNRCSRIIRKLHRPFISLPFTAETPSWWLLILMGRPCHSNCHWAVCPAQSIAVFGCSFYEKEIWINPLWWQWHVAFEEMWATQAIERCKNCCIIWRFCRHPLSCYFIRGRQGKPGRKQIKT